VIAMDFYFVTMEEAQAELDWYFAEAKNLGQETDAFLGRFEEDGIVAYEVVGLPDWSLDMPVGVDEIYLGEEDAKVFAEKNNLRIIQA
jgi:hypothetical protein